MSRRFQASMWHARSPRSPPTSPTSQPNGFEGISRFGVGAHPPQLAPPKLVGDAQRTLDWDAAALALADYAESADEAVTAGVSDGNIFDPPGVPNLIHPGEVFGPSLGAV